MQSHYWDGYSTPQSEYFESEEGDLIWMQGRPCVVQSVINESANNSVITLTHGPTQITFDCSLPPNCRLYYIWYDQPLAIPHIKVIRVKSI